MPVSMRIHLETPLLPVHPKSLTVPYLIKMITLVVELDSVIYILRINLVAEYL
jgi:hypothetical protein